MLPQSEFLLTLLIFATALLYASVGQAGASGYLAAMALFGIAPEVMKPTALTLNILVAAIAMFKFYRAGYFTWSLFWPFAVTSIPFSFVGGLINLPGYLYEPVVGIVLLYAAYLLLRKGRNQQPVEIKPVMRRWALASGAGIGLLSGMTGIGGGIFLSPLLLFMGWAETRQTSGLTAAFILVNSMAGLLGYISSITTLPGSLTAWAAAAVVGGYIGAEYGSKRFGHVTLNRLLVIVLIIAGIKIIFT